MKNTYIITKIVQAKNITEALKLEKSAEVEMIELKRTPKQEDEEPDSSFGFKQR